ncbi:hypothetical protein [Clostridium senegalense]|uniref:hypothetical protein n=1 Tax=Clostridium senegalense TaxID=1465809 RepID=UPI000289953E|nr:hypothetical protein [Clostridium senegalense]
MWENFKSWCAEKTLTTIGEGLMASGMVGEELAKVVVMIGVLLILFKHTKVLRYGLKTYGLAIITQVLGYVLTIIK